MTKTTKPFQRTFPVHIGGQTRHLRFTHDDLLFASAMLIKVGLPASAREAILFHRDVLSVATVAAAGLRHEDKRMNPRRITAWLDEGLGSYASLEAAVVEAIEAAYEVLDGHSGEARAPATTAPAPATTPTPTSTPGAELSSSLPDSASLGTSSGD